MLTLYICSLGDSADFEIVSFCPGDVAVSGDSGVSREQVCDWEDGLEDQDGAGEDGVPGEAVCVSGEQTWESHGD